MLTKLLSEKQSHKIYTLKKMFLALKHLSKFTISLVINHLEKKGKLEL